MSNELHNGVLTYIRARANAEGWTNELIHDIYEYGGTAGALSGSGE